jgi:hypothetical protein
MDNDRLRAIEQKANTAGDDDVLFLLAIVARLRSEMGVMRDERDEAMAILRDIVNEWTGAEWCDAAERYLRLMDTKAEGK